VHFTSYVDRYVLSHDLADSTIQQLRNAAKLFDRWAGDVPLCDDLLNGWLFYRKECGLRPDTVRGNRTSILMLWRDAFETGAAGSTVFARSYDVARITRRSVPLPPPIS
jgi:hypothetical protein